MSTKRKKLTWRIDITFYCKPLNFVCIPHSLLGKCCPGQHVNVDLYLTSGSPRQRSGPRYAMTVVDIQQSSAKNGKFAIFIVPQGTVKINLSVVTYGHLKHMPQEPCSWRVKC